jgi:hypothetical protein
LTTTPSNFSSRRPTINADAHEPQTYVVLLSFPLNTIVASLRRSITALVPGAGSEISFSGTFLISVIETILSAGAFAEPFDHAGVVSTIAGAGLNVYGFVGSDLLVDAAEVRTRGFQLVPASHQLLDPQSGVAFRVI